MMIYEGFSNFSLENLAQLIQYPYKNAEKKENVENIIEEQQKNYLDVCLN